MIALPTDPDRLYEIHERIAIKIDSGIPEREAERQATEEQAEQMRLEP